MSENNESTSKYSPIQIPVNIFTLCSMNEPEYSSLLAFFLNTSLFHGFRDLWIRALLNCLKISQDTQTIPTFAMCEYNVGKGKKIDLFVETPNYIIGIENKISAKLGNQFDIYSEKIQEEAQNKKKIPYKIILAPSGYENRNKANLKKLRKDNWQFITYSELFEQVQDLLGEYTTCNPSFLIQMNEFMETIKFIEYFNTDTEKNNSTYSKSYKKHKKELKKHYNKINKRIYNEFKQHDIYSKSAGDDAFYFIAISVHKSETIAAEVYFDLDGWRIALFNYKQQFSETYKRIIDTYIHIFHNVPVYQTQITQHRRNRVPLTAPIPFEDYNKVLEELHRAVDIINKYFPEVNS